MDSTHRIPASDNWAQAFSDIGATNIKRVKSVKPGITLISVSMDFIASDNSRAYAANYDRTFPQASNF